MSQLEQNDTNTTAADGSASVLGVILGVLAFIIPALGLESVAGTIVVLDWRKKQSVAKHLVLVLIVTDFLGTLNIIVHILVKINFPTTDFFCYIFDVTQALTLQVSGFIVLTMAIDRALALKAPYWYSRNITVTVVWIILLVQILCSVFISIFPFIGLGSVRTVKVVNGVKVEACGIFPFVQLTDGREAVFSLTYSTIGAVFLVVVIFCNGLVIREMKKMRSIIPWPTHIRLQRPEFRMTKVLLALSVTFVMCWSPLIVLLFLAQAGVYIDKRARTVVFVVASLNFIFDSGVYILMNKKYRQNIAKMCCRSPPGNTSVGPIEQNDS